IRIELHQADLESPALQQGAPRSRCEAFSKTGHNTTAPEDIFRRHELLAHLKTLDFGFFGGSGPRLENGLCQVPWDGLACTIRETGGRLWQAGGNAHSVRRRGDAEFGRVSESITTDDTDNTDSH